MPSYLWAALDRPSLGAMASTLHFDDVGVDDETTGETASDADGSAVCGDILAEVFLTGVADLGALLDITAWRFTTLFAQGIPSFAACLAPPDPVVTLTGNYSVEISSDGTSWTEIDSGDLSATYGTPTTTNGVLSATTVRYVRVVLYGAYGHTNAITPADPFEVFITLSDFRLTSSAPAGCDVPPPPTLRTTTQVIAGIGQITILGNQ